jgi:hypothetical protein
MPQPLRWDLKEPQIPRQQARLIAIRTGSKG